MQCSHVHMMFGTVRVQFSALVPTTMIIPCCPSAAALLDIFPCLAASECAYTTYANQDPVNLYTPGKTLCGKYSGHEFNGACAVGNTVAAAMQVCNYFPGCESLWKQNGGYWVHNVGATGGFTTSPGAGPAYVKSSGCQGMCGCFFLFLSPFCTPSFAHTHTHTHISEVRTTSV